jgi:hypothetical protein
VLKDKGKVYTQVAELLRLRGIDTKGMRIFSGGRGPYHLVVINDEVIGEYNHNTKKLSIHADIIAE